MFEIISRSSLSLTAGLLLFRLILREQSLQAQTQIQSCHGEPNVKAQAHPLPNISSRCSTPCHLKPLVTTSSLWLNHTKITLNPGPRPTPSIPTPSSESFLGFLHIATTCEAQRATDGHFDGWRRSRRLPRPPRRRLGCHLVLASRWMLDISWHVANDGIYLAFRGANGQKLCRRLKLTSRMWPNPQQRRGTHPSPAVLKASNENCKQQSGPHDSLRVTPGEDWVVLLQLPTAVWLTNCLWQVCFVPRLLGYSVVLTVDLACTPSMISLCLVSAVPWKSIKTASETDF